MGLTSDKVLVSAVVLAVALFLATVWLWPRLARRGWRPVAGRVGLLLVTQVVLFATVGLAANRSFLFYGSWADLFGQEQEMGVVVDHAAGSKHLRVLGTQALDVPGGGRPSVGGQIQKVMVAGGRSGIVSPAYVYLPPEYFQPQYAKRTFPASVVLTGYPGMAENLLKGLNYPKTAYLQAKAGRMQPMILVMLRPTVAPPRDTECVDVPGGPQTETFFAQDLPKAVSETYRVGKRARNWGFMGNSTGGYCALKMALHHPDRFMAGVGFSAYYRAAEDVTTGDLFHGDDGLRKRGDLLWSLDHRPRGETSLLVTSSKRGEGNLKETRRFIRKAKSPVTVSSIILDSGGHNFNTWNRELPPGLIWMGGRLSAN
ncbi:esterase [Streptomyces litmocidini]|uniref:alpha/beta hydrolase n=1 Tax=Streptomyces litmocidini TaxID=67318 RepID=UPI00167CF11A|nr:alpha/beta hydrolase-fold protein [Streptomyces litmocidini]GGU79371.1 esterase [Streptomyces litmocidini]